MTAQPFQMFKHQQATTNSLRITTVKKKNTQAPAENTDKGKLEHEIDASGNPKSKMFNLTHVGSR